MRGNERTDANIPRLTNNCQSPAASTVSPARTSRAMLRASTGGAGRQELLDGLVDHGIGETGMMAAGTARISIQIIPADTIAAAAQAEKKTSGWPVGSSSHKN